MEKLPRATLSSFSSMKIGEIKRWLVRSDVDCLSILLLYGSSGSGKRTSLISLMRDLNLDYEEVFSDHIKSTLGSLIDIACISSKENVLVYPEFIYAHEISTFMDSLSKVNRIAQFKKRLLIVFSLEPYAQISWAPLHSSITKIHIPPITEQKITKILGTYMDKDSNLGLPSSSCIDISMIAKHAHGDLRYAIQQLRWIRTQPWDDPGKLEKAGLDVRTLQYTPDRISLKLLCGKEEYNSLESMDFLDGVYPHVLIECLRKNLLRYFPPSGVHSLAQILEALALSETCVRAPSVTSKTKPWLLIFLSAYKIYNPVPTKGTDGVPTKPLDKKRSPIENKLSWSTKENEFISSSIEEKLFPGEKLYTDDRLTQEPRFEWCIPSLYYNQLHSPTSNCVSQNNYLNTHCTLHLEDDDIEFE
ncbi:beta-phosphoglucomutase [Perkinsela sp. CCAP 1560/4]|nr:beta-phosphoglucomutase [Perkinsela sp. CCAP 1560/4]|eukprot:KNH06087.1 beta-phosphoglucomutase [Perkinsela sp. CCAP 1560/4]